MESPCLLTTDRLRLAPFAAKDAAALEALWNEPEMGRYLFDGEPVPRARVLEHIAASERHFASIGCGYFGVRLNEAPARLIGFVGLRPFGEPERIELLYGFASSHRGRGLATEAAAAVLRLAFDGLGLGEIWAGADPPNAASFRVMERLGMSFREEITIDGRPARYYVVIAPPPSRGA